VPIAAILELLPTMLQALSSIVTALEHAHAGNAAAAQQHVGAALTSTEQLHEKLSSVAGPSSAPEGT
jgi:hypothetical protein